MLSTKLIDVPSSRLSCSASGLPRQASSHRSTFCAGRFAPRCGRQSNRDRIDTGEGYVAEPASTNGQAMAANSKSQAIAANTMPPVVVGDSETSSNMPLLGEQQELLR